MSETVFLAGFRGGKEKAELARALQGAGHRVAVMLTRTVTRIVVGPLGASARERERFASSAPQSLVLESPDSLFACQSAAAADFVDTAASSSSSSAAAAPSLLKLSAVVPRVCKRGYVGPLALFGRGLTRQQQNPPRVRFGAETLPADLVEAHGPDALFVRRIPLATARAAAAEKPSAVAVAVSADGGASWSNAVEVAFERPTSKEEPSASSSATDQRELRIFISSTFADMAVERDEVVKAVLPSLRKQLRDRNVAVSCVDLRWGVSSAQSLSGTALLLCLQELERSSILLGFIGDRYGLCDHGADTEEDRMVQRAFAAAAKRFPQAAAFADRSFTEAEMQMVLSGAFEKPAFFFCRDSSFVDSVPPFDRHLYVCSSPAESLKLSGLKKEIAESGFPVRIYKNPGQVAEALLRELSRWADTQFPPTEHQSTEQQQAVAHRGFAMLHRQSHLPREELFYAIHRHAVSSHGGKQPLVVVGDSGGKSALLVNWAARHREQFPEDLVFEHYIGCNAASTNATNILRRTMQTLAAWLSWKEPIPEGKEELVPEFSSWLERAASSTAGNRIVLVFDGLDKVEDADGGLDLLWLPQAFPSGVRVLLSTASGKALDAVVRRGWPMLQVPPFKPSDALSFSRLFLARSSKRFNAAQEIRVAEAPQAASPLWLRVFLSELAVFGNYEDLDARIDELLEHRTIEELYRAVLERVQRDYDAAGTGFVSLFFSAIWASRKGLQQSELEELVAGQGFRETDLHGLLAATEDLVFSSGGLLSFLGDKLKTAVRDAFFANEQEQRFAHEQLANFFATKTEASGQSAPAREFAELAWQLEQCENWPRLTETLCNIDAFLKMFASEEFKFMLMRWWRKLSKLSTGAVDIPDAFKKMLDAHVLDASTRLGAESINPQPFMQAATFLEEIAQFRAAEETFALAQLYCPKADTTTLGDISSSLARLYERENKFSEAEAVLEQLLKSNPPTNELDLARALNRLGAVLTKSNKLQRAEDALLQALHIRERLLGTAHSRVGQTLKHLISLYEALGQYDKAQSCGVRSLKITEDTLGPDSFHVSTILLKLGILHNTLKQHAESESALRRALEIRTEKYGAEHPFVAEVLHNFAAVYVERREWEKAEDYFIRALAIMKRTAGMERTAIAQIQLRLAEVYRWTGRLAEAEPLLLESLMTRRDVLGEMHPRVGQSYKHLAALYLAQGKMTEAEQMGLLSLLLTEKAFGPDHYHTSSALLQLGKVYAATRRPEEAQKVLQRALHIRTIAMGASCPATTQVQQEIERLHHH